MSHPNSILDPQVADALTFINTSVVAAVPSVALGAQFVNLGFAQTLAAYNAVFAQQQAYMTGQAAAVADVVAILGR